MNPEQQHTQEPEHPADLADEIQRLPVKEAVQTIRSLPRERASTVIAELDRQAGADILAELRTDEISALLTDLPHDEAADLVAELPQEQRQNVLARLVPTESAKVAELLHYPEDSAGGIMTDRFIALRMDATIKECHGTLRQHEEEEYERATYLYAVDADNKLVGVVSIRDLVFRNPDRKIMEIMNKDVKYVYVDDDQEKVAQLFTQYHYMALPVLETDGRLVGVVEANSVIDVIQEEATEDMHLMVGLTGEESPNTTWQKSVTKRLPWLYVNLATACMAATVIGFFESTIARWTALAVFFPIIAGQGGNAGMQTMTVIIRGMALGKISGKDYRSVLIKEIILSLVNGLAVGIVVGIVGFIWKGSIMFGIIACVAMFLNMLAAASSGVLIPYGLKMLKIDPALASSIFLTTVTDIGAFLFFLGLAAFVMHFFAV